MRSEGDGEREREVVLSASCGSDTCLLTTSQTRMRDIRGVPTKLARGVSWISNDNWDNEVFNANDDSDRGRAVTRAGTLTRDEHEDESLEAPAGALRLGQRTTTTVESPGARSVSRWKRVSASSRMLWPDSEPRGKAAFLLASGLSIMCAFLYSLANGAGRW